METTTTLPRPSTEARDAVIASNGCILRKDLPGAISVLQSYSQQLSCQPATPQRMADIMLIETATTELLEVVELCRQEQAQQTIQECWQEMVFGGEVITQ